MNVMEMRMIRLMSELTRLDRIKNEYMRGSVGLALIVDKMRENRLKWFGHMVKREGTKAVRVFMEMNVEEKSRKERSKRR
jgi:hypothetical protein